MIRHLLGLADFPDQGQSVDDFADVPAQAMAIGDPRVLDPSGVQRQVVVVVGHKDPAFRSGMGELRRVGGTE